jgi:sigma-B regulation protein RsbU (phosphoserine phosphatase)
MPMKVLIVDDEPDLEVLIKQRFRKRIKDGEFEFVFARDGQEALNKLQDDPALDIVMSDINMPVMDGLTLLSRLSDVNRILKAVIVSAYGDMQNIRTAMNLGAFDFLTKPIDFQDFEVTLNKTIQELETIKEGFQARERLTALQHELSIAARIQQSILPRFPAFPSRTDFEIYAQTIPAREVGGDFFDFFLIDRNRLGFSIGDVSGKGIPAAILMAVCRTLLKATAMQNLSAGECLKFVNDVLVRQSDNAMFVTMFYGILNTDTGELEYCLGGHEPPWALSPSGNLLKLNEPGNLIVGAFEEATFQTGRTQLNSGDCVVLFTDGVTEATNGIGAEFQESRLSTVLYQTVGSPVEQIVASMIDEVRIFSADGQQGDDITAMAVRFVGPN